MSKAKIKLQIPADDSDSQNFYITVHSNGKKLGEITISDEKFQWYSYKGSKATTISWEKLDKMMGILD